MRKVYNKSIIASMLLIMSLVVGCNTDSSISNNKTNTNTITDAPLEITVLNTGSSDCILIEIEDKTIMIDTGLKSNGDYIVDSLNEKEITKIDYLILTHMDKDHIGGVPKVLDSVTVSNVIAADYIKDSKQYTNYIEALSNHGISANLLHENLNLELNGAEINIYPAEKETYLESNDYSIIVGITYGEYSYLFAGDAEEERLAEFVNSNEKQYDFVKIPHHGRYNSLSEAFITDINPIYAVITCSEKEPADDEELTMLQEKGIETYLNMNGDIIVKSDGKDISIEQNRK